MVKVLVRMDLLANILNFSGKILEHSYHRFRKGYCYYLKKIYLQAFGFLNFGPSDNSSFRTIDFEIRAYVMQNKIISEHLYPQQGCIQGDPISPYMFTICKSLRNKNKKFDVFRCEYRVGLDLFSNWPNKFLIT